MDLAIIIPAAGIGSRLGKNIPKAFVKIQGKTLLEYCLASIQAINIVGANMKILVGVPAGNVALAQQILGEQVMVYAGEKERGETVAKGVALLANQPVDYVIVHDAARPFASSDLYQRLIAATVKSPAVIPVLDSVDSLKRVNDYGEVVANVARKDIKIVQTPQIYQYSLLQKAFQTGDTSTATDESELVINLGQPVTTIPGEMSAKKLTTIEDLEYFNFLLAGKEKKLCE